MNPHLGKVKNLNFNRCDQKPVTVDAIINSDKIITQTPVLVIYLTNYESLLYGQIS